MLSRSVSLARLVSGGATSAKDFVDDENSAALMQIVRQAQQRPLLDDTSVRIVRIDQDGEIGVAKLVDVGGFGHGMARQRRCTSMLRVGRSQDQRLARLRQSGDLRQQDLCARRGDHMLRGWRAIGLCRDRRELSYAGPVRQPRQNLRRQSGQGPRLGPRMGIDPGRKIDERFRRAGKHFSRRGDIAAMRHRLDCRLTGLGPNEHRDHLTGPAH